MKHVILSTIIAAAAVCAPASAAESPKNIRISTDETDLVLQVAPNGRLYQVYFGERLKHESDLNSLEWSVHAGSDGSVTTRGWEVYGGSGGEDYFEPALAVTHADGNPTTYLYYQSSETKAVSGGTQTDIRLRDDRYPLSVTLHYVAYAAENVIKTWSEISHDERGSVTLDRYASTMLYFNEPAYYLTEFSSDWAREAQMTTQRLLPGKKVLDTKLGSRAAMLMQPFFQLGLDGTAKEAAGRVLTGTIGWTGNFSMTFEVDNVGNLRVIPAINPYASAYKLERGEVFTTPEFIFTLSQSGAGQASRNLHSWARKYQLKDGLGPRLTLLNNWENTGFRFDEAKLSALMKEANDLGVDMFLLDDGWFGNKHPRNNDRQGLGDWQANASKLPGGLAALVKAADEVGVKFGLWIEPEMVNPKSELYEKHPDWAIHLPNRDVYYYRNQLVLDLSNPEVQDYVFGVVDRLMTENPGIAYFKWDCNSPITNIYSPYLKENQGRMYIDHVRGVYSVMRRVAEKYPEVPMMLCSGGGARCDYEALKYFTEFWPSDNTDPVERLYIQWGFSQVFPAKAMCAHVTNWDKTASVKFRTDVASMCKLGFDIGLHRLTADELEFCRRAVANWKELSPVIMDGGQYRLVSPYEGNHMAVSYVSEDRQRAVLFAYDIHPRYQEKLHRVRLQGLDPDKTYTVRETNLMPGAKPSLKAEGKTFTGDYLMKVGLDVFGFAAMQSRIVVLE